MEQEQGSSMSIERVGSKVVLSIRGALDSEATPRFGHFLEDLIDGQGNLDVVIDLRGMASVDGETVDILVSATHRMRSRGGRLVLAGYNQPVRDTLHSPPLRLTGA